MNFLGLQVKVDDVYGKRREYGNFYGKSSDYGGTYGGYGYFDSAKSKEGGYRQDLNHGNSYGYGQGLGMKKRGAKQDQPHGNTAYGRSASYAGAGYGYGHPGYNAGHYGNYGWSKSGRIGQNAHR